jgi:2-oxoglutarate ferredoxin oxidoreductase subunit beta
VRAHNAELNTLDFITTKAPISVEYPEGSVQDVNLHDGSTIRLRKLSTDYDIHDRGAAMNHIYQLGRSGEIATGLIYIDEEPSDMHARLGTAKKPLNALSDRDIVPGAAALAKINAGLR